MKQGRVTVKVIPDSRRPKSGERFPLKLRITFKGERKYYATGYDATEEEWDLINSKEVRGKWQTVRNNLGTLEERALACARKIVPFSFAVFERDFFVQAPVYQDVEAAYKAYIAELNSNDQVGTAISYQNSVNTLLRFRPALRFEEVTKEFLNDFERWMLAKKRSISTVGMYLRTLRSIFNIAIEAGRVRPEFYPFGKRRYVIPTGRNVKKALTIDQIKKIVEYPTDPGSIPDKCRDFWILSYLCNGMNMADILRLRWSNLSPDTITFAREKTKRTKRENPVNIVVVRNARINAILDKWCQKGDDNTGGLLFDVLSDTDHPVVARKKVQLFIHMVNDNMRPLGEDLKFDLPLTTYVARHSFATILVRNGAPLALAKQTLGHASITTTEKYFAGFDLAAQEQYTRAMSNF